MKTTTFDRSALRAATIAATDTQGVALEAKAMRQAGSHLLGARPRAFCVALLFDYSIIALVIATMLNLATPLSFWLLCPVAWIIIAARQHAILVLMHDATHYLAHPVRWCNDALGELGCGAPLLVSMSKYRRDHLAHHRHLNTNEDPDWVRKTGDAAEAPYWVFPVQGNGFGFLLRSWSRSVAYLLRSVTHLSGSGSGSDSGSGAEDAAATVGACAKNRGAVDTTSRWLCRARLGFYLALALVLSVTGGWSAFALFWLAPVLLVLPIIMRLRSIAEHFALPCRNRFDSSRTIHCGPVERFLFAPHRVNHHLDHHLLASVSFAELPALHEAFMQMPQYRRQAHVNEGYLFGRHSLLRDMVAGNGHRNPIAALLPQRAGAT